MSDDLIERLRREIEARTASTGCSKVLTDLLVECRDRIESLTRSSAPLSESAPDAEQFKRRIYLALNDPQEYAGKRQGRSTAAWNMEAVWNSIRPLISSVPLPESVRDIKAALKAGRGYVADASAGALVYQGAGRVDPVVAESDLISIERALALLQSSAPAKANAGEGE